MYMSCGLLLSITFIKYFKITASLVKLSTHTMKFDQKCTLEENFGLSELENANVKKWHRLRGLHRVPGRSLGSVLL